MVTIDEYFGNYLKSEDIKGEQVLTIETCKAEEVGKEDIRESKLAVYFRGQEKPLILNKVNAEAIAEIANSRVVESWVGVAVCLYVDPNVMFGGKRVGGIRVKKPVK